jgi:hypothetical protein
LGCGQQERDEARNLILIRAILECEYLFELIDEDKQGAATPQSLPPISRVGARLERISFLNQVDKAIGACSEDGGDPLPCKGIARKVWPKGGDGAEALGKRFKRPASRAALRYEPLSSRAREIPLLEPAK